jgi:hypothetical protein
MGFREFLLNEEKSHLGHRLSDVLTSIRDIQDDMENLGSRHLSRLADQIVDEFRKIIHGNWGDQQVKHLKAVQRCAVALKKAIEDRDDLKEVVPAIAQELQQILTKMKIKVNDLEAPDQQGQEGDPVKQSDFEITPPQPKQQDQGGQGEDQQNQPQEEPPPGADAGGMGPMPQ